MNRFDLVCWNLVGLGQHAYVAVVQGSEVEEVVDVCPPEDEATNSVWQGLQREELVSKEEDVDE